MADVRKKWSVASFDGSEAEEVWTVTGVNSLAEARLAAGIPQLNTPFDGNPAMKSMEPKASKAGFKLYEVSIRYGIPPSGDWTPPTGDPLSEPAKWWWEPGSESALFDYAYDDDNERTIPYLNSAFDPFDQPMPDETGTLYLHVEKTLEDMPLATAILYQNATNDSAFTILGRYDVDEGQCRCVILAPTTEQTATTTKVRVRLTLEFRQDGFKHRQLDQGFQSFNVGGEKMPMCDGRGSRFADPMRLDGAGKPRESSVKVNPKDPELAATNPAALPAAVEVETTNDATWLKFKRKKSLDFGTLLSLFN